MKSLDKKTWIYIGIGAVVIAAVIALVCVLGKGESGESVNEEPEASNTVTATYENGEASQTEAPAEEKVYTPTFMYFVSKSDADYDKAMTAVSELKEEYGDKVKFDIVDVDENPEAKTNFEMVDGNTPFLIMLNTKNDITAFEFKCADKAKLAADIENAFK